MEIIKEYGREGLAKVYVAKLREKYLIEFAEALQPPLLREQKWVLILSTLLGCPVKCKLCDACKNFYGKLSTHEILQQIDYLVKLRFPSGKIPVAKFKLQFARMGEPALNPNVLDVLEVLPSRYAAPGLMPCISTIAPKGSEPFFERLLEIKKRFYRDHFQLQFSIHTTNPEKRAELIPAKLWDFEEIATYGERFFDWDRKITLNFAVIKGYDVESEIIRKYFDPDKFLIKLTPLNPTERAKEHGLVSFIDPYNAGSASELVDAFRSKGFETILSIGEPEENEIGSNCGLFISNNLTASAP